MTELTPSPAKLEVLDLTGRKGLVVGIANEHSLAWSAARHFRMAGAELAITYLNDKARPFVEPLAREVTAPIFAPCDVSAPGQLEAVFAEIRSEEHTSELQSLMSISYAVFCLKQKK